MTTYLLVSLTIGILGAVATWSVEDEQPKWWQFVGLAVMIAVLWPGLLVAFVMDWCA